MVFIRIDHREYFGNDNLVTLFTDTEICLKQVNVILNMTLQAALDLGRRARRLSLSKRYDYFSRTRKFLSDINEFRI